MTQLFVARDRRRWYQYCRCLMKSPVDCLSVALYSMWCLLLSVRSSVVDWANNVRIVWQPVIITDLTTTTSTTITVVANATTRWLVPGNSTYDRPETDDVSIHYEARQRRRFPPGSCVQTRPLLRPVEFIPLVDPTKFWEGFEDAHIWLWTRMHIGRECHVSHSRTTYEWDSDFTRTENRHHQRRFPKLKCMQMRWRPLGELTTPPSWIGVRKGGLGMEG